MKFFPPQKKNIFPFIGLSRGLVNLINGESLMTSIMSLITFTGIVHIKSGMQRKTNYSLGKDLFSSEFLKIRLLYFLKAAKVL